MDLCEISEDYFLIDEGILLPLIPPFDSELLRSSGFTNEFISKVTSLSLSVIAALVRPASAGPTRRTILLVFQKDSRPGESLRRPGKRE